MLCVLILGSKGGMLEIEFKFADGKCLKIFSWGKSLKILANSLRNSSMFR